MPVETDLNCLGYYGFGGGYLLGKEGPAAADAPLYCSACPLAQECWTKHRETARAMLPDLSEVFDALLVEKENDGAAAAKAFYDRYQVAPPDLAVMGGNIQDGAYVATTGKPKDRGKSTLPWPFRKN